MPCVTLRMLSISACFRFVPGGGPDRVHFRVSSTKSTVSSAIVPSGVTGL